MYFQCYDVFCPQKNYSGFFPLRPSEMRRHPFRCEYGPFGYKKTLNRFQSRASSLF
jgi:hypothetical protein